MAEGSSGSGVIRKLIVSIILGVVIWFGSGELGFAQVFQCMFVVYVGLGFLVFVLLDAPPLPRLSGWMAVAASIGFYAVISASYILGAIALPQYDPEVEKGKIEKILKRKRERFQMKSQEVDNLLVKMQAIEGKTQKVMARLSKIAPAVAPSPMKGTGSTGAMTVVDRGKEVYELYECYNCHKIGGVGGKKRGPILDNIGTYLTVEDIKRKIFDPTYLYAEGFEKQHKKGKMPDKYKELMDEEEVNALSTYLSTLKDTSVNTPKPIFVKSNVEHGYTVFGYVRDSKGTPLPGVKVHVMPKKKGGHGASGSTNDAGYYEVFIHMHNEDVGTTVTVSAQNTQQDFVADYDPNDKVTKRQKSLDFIIAGSL